jgi:hypothetical protein
MSSEAVVLDTITPAAPVGSLSVLNVGAGDITVNFDPGSPEEVVKGLRMLMDMQKRGYLIAVKLPDGSYVRAVEIDPTAGCYVISLPADASPELLATLRAVVLDEPDAGDLPRRRRGRPRKLRAPEGAVVITNAEEPGTVAATDASPRKRGRSRKVRVPIATSEAIGVARSAGG